MKTYILILIVIIASIHYGIDLNCDFHTSKHNDRVELDTLSINWYLNEPIDFKKLDNKKIRVKKKELKSEKITGKRISLEYQYKKNTIAEVEGFQIHRGSSWPFGHSGWFMNKFICYSKKMPLKLKLKVGTRVEEFIKFFGKPTKQSSTNLFYDFSEWDSNKKLNIDIINNRVSKITIIRVNPL